ncbi:hypothetical protein FB451DRAFT_1023138 [Mycena latifolia]|nr:hypothetical protein FB451DRAFT_1023138 [Mycena latifolia]
MPRASVVVDHVNPFEAGSHYGPVLDPLQTHAVRVKLRLNPLLQPPTAPGVLPQLEWNMLFPSNRCRRSGDPMHMSWWKGRHEPVTFPRVTRIRLVSEVFPWMINIAAGNPDVGVTCGACGELIDHIARDMDQFVKQGEYEVLPRIQKDALRRAYRHNRSRVDGVPGGQLDPPMRRLDWLGHYTMFGGIQENNTLVKHVCGDILPCSFELVCIPRDPIPEQGIPDQEEVDEQENSSRAWSPWNLARTQDDEEGIDDASENSEETFDGEDEQENLNRANETPWDLVHVQDDNEGNDDTSENLEEIFEGGEDDDEWRAGGVLETIVESREEESERPVARLGTSFHYPFDEEISSRSGRNDDGEA